MYLQITNKFCINMIVTSCDLIYRNTIECTTVAFNRPGNYWFRLNKALANKYFMELSYQ